MTKAGTIESGYTAQNMIDYSLKHHCRKLAIADNGTSITCMAKIDIDTAVLFQTAPENKAVEKRVKLAFVDKSIDADIGSRSYDYIKPDQINSALNAITKPDKPQISKYSPLDMNEIDKLLEKMTKLKSSFDEHLSKVNESNLTSDLWLDKLSSIQQETAKTAIALKSKLSSAIAETCKKTAHFQSDYYKMIDTQQANFKQHEGIVSRLNKMKIKNDRLRKICKAKLEQSAIDTHDQNLVDTVARSTADMSKFVDVVKSRFEAVV